MLCIEHKNAFSGFPIFPHAGKRRKFQLWKRKTSSGFE